MRKVLSVLILACLFLLQSCATTVTSYKKHKATPAVDLFKDKTVTVRVNARTTYGKSRAIIYSNKQYESAIKHFLGEETNIRYLTPEADYLYFQDEALKRRGEFLQTELQNDSSDYFLDVYTNHDFAGVHDPKMYGLFLMGGLHLLSLGLIPIYIEVPEKIELALYDNKKNLIKKSKAVTYSKSWMWSPFIFRKDATKGYDKETRVKASINNLGFALKKLTNQKK